MKYKKIKTQKNIKRKSKSIKKHIFSNKKSIKKSYLNFKGGDDILPTAFTFNKEYIKTDKAKKIGNFMLSNRDKIKSLFLKTICSDSGLCIAFGVEGDKIKKFFDNFTSGNYVSFPIKRIGKASVNGFVDAITYEREGYKANAVLKSMVNYQSDNLYYEYLVGKFINKWNLIYPCFLETYGLFKYNSYEDWEYVHKFHEIYKKNILKENLTYIPDPTISDSCTNFLDLALLIQHINNSKTLHDVINENKNNNNDFFKFELINILYQIYMPLAAMKDIYTHYDLHPGNVLLYEPIQNKYIQYYYHSINPLKPVVEFKSKYIVKIIDYGRSYFKDDTIDALKVYNEVCSTKECTPCGVDYGYYYLSPEKYPGKSHYISSQKKNASHDLRLLDYLKKYGLDTFHELNILLSNVIYDEDYGTKENLSFDQNKIQNVKDAFEEMEKILLIGKIKGVNNNIYSKMGKIGDLNIYEDGRPMEFIKSQ